MVANNARNPILARIREALKITAPPRHLEQHGHLRATPTPETRRDWLPPVPPEWEGQVELFVKNSAALKTEWFRCRSAQELSSNLQQLAVSSGWTRIATHALTFGREALDALTLPKVETDSSFAINDLEQASAGITNCEYLIAQTGSILISTPSSGGRSLSVLPPHHVVIAQRSQLVSDLVEAFRALRTRYAGNFPSYLSFITGPSRTGDIERMLVLGAHGPKRLSVLFADY